MKRFINKNKGFSLVEVLLYLGIFIVLISIITLFAASLIKSVNKGHIKKEVVRGAYSAISSIIYEIENSENIYIPTSVFNHYPGQLSLKTTQKLPEGERDTYVDFYLDENNKIYIKREGREPFLLISDNLIVTNFEFQRLSSVSDSIRIFLTVGYDIPDPEYQYSYTLISSATTRK